MTLTRVNDGRSWSFSKAASDGDFYVDNGWYGQRGCIILSIWRLDIYSLETRRMVMLVNSCYNNYMPIFAL